MASVSGKGKLADNKWQVRVKFHLSRFPRLMIVALRIRDISSNNSRDFVYAEKF
jgi:hypothetical protein